MRALLAPDLRLGEAPEPAPEPEPDSEGPGWDLARADGKLVLRIG